MNLSKRASAALSGAGILMVVAGAALAANGVLTHTGPLASAANPSIRALVQSRAEAATIQWQSLFVEEPQPGVTSPDQVTADAHPMSPASLAGFVAQSTRAAARLFTGQPLDVLKQSIASEASSYAELSGGYSVCVAAGANSLHVTKVSVWGGSATVELTAHAWTSDVDVSPADRPRVDTAQGLGKYQVKLSRSTSGPWLVTSFSVDPIEK